MNLRVRPATLWVPPLDPECLAVLRRWCGEGTDEFFQKAWQQTHEDFERFRRGQRPLGVHTRDMLDGFLSAHRAYEPSSIRTLERFRDSLPKLKKDPKLRSYEGRPQVLFGVVVHGLQLIDPTNLIFELQGEASVGSPFAHVSAYLAETGRQLLRSDLKQQVSLDGILCLPDDATEKLLRSLLQIRMRGGKLETSHSYFRYGSISDRVWLIQEFEARIYLEGDYRHLPFDCFPVVADFNVGLGGDIVNVELCVEDKTGKPVEQSGGTYLFSRDFDAGEFEADKERGTLTAIGYLEDPTHFVDNIARLVFWVQRPARRMLSRIGLPLLAMVALLFTGAVLKVDDMISAVIPTILVAIVGLQLTAAQGMPRHAPLSLLDLCFIASYTFAVALFLVLASNRDSVVPWLGCAYLLGVSVLLFRGWQRRRARRDGRTSPWFKEGVTMKTIRELVLAGAITGLGMLFGASLYESIVNAPNFVNGVPESLEHVRRFWSVANPGSYFRIVAPATQVLALLALILSWKRPAGRRGWLLAAFLLIVAADAITFTYHYPRNDLLFTSPLSQSPEALERAAREWGTMNWVRVALCFAAVSSALAAYARREPAGERPAP